MFKFKKHYYAISKRDGGTGGILQQNPNHDLLTWLPENYLIPGMRHAAVLVHKPDIFIFYSMISAKPERIMMTHIKTQDSSTPKDWKLSYPKEILTPALDYEGASLPLEASLSGVSYEAKNELRDPAILQDKDSIYLYYTIKGELGIAAAELQLLHI